MDLVCLLDSCFVAFADDQILIDFFHPAFGVCFELKVLLVDCYEGVPHGADIVIFLLFHVFVHALHAHEDGFLLAVEHERLFVDVALHFSHFLALPTFIIVCPIDGIVTRLAVAFVYVRSFSLSVDVVSALGVRHFSEFAFAQFSISFCIVRLLKLIFAELRTLHIPEQQLIFLLFDQILNAQSCGILAASGTA